MPTVLLAGTVTAKPKVQTFPAEGRPRCEVRLEVDDDLVTIFRIVGYDDQTAELETLLPGDSVAVQGKLEFELKDGHLTGIYVTALQVMALRKRSIHRLPGSKIV
jgi:single-stranded DNA-binding protein